MGMNRDLLEFGSFQVESKTIFSGWILGTDTIPYERAEHWGKRHWGVTGAVTPGNWEEKSSQTVGEKTRAMEGMRKKILLGRNPSL